jgi:hypothetical protein
MDIGPPAKAFRAPAMDLLRIVLGGPAKENVPVKDALGALDAKLPQRISKGAGSGRFAERSAQLRERGSRHRDMFGK